MLEADRFQNLKYSPEIFKTETLAVLGEYNKNSADPSEALWEKLQDTAFLKHTYKHTTMGFLADVQDMPNQYDYGIEFFRRYYRPEYTTIIVAGDVAQDQVRPVVERYWGSGSAANIRPPSRRAAAGSPAHRRHRLAHAHAALARGRLPRPRLFRSRSRLGRAQRALLPRLFRPTPISTGSS